MEKTTISRRVVLGGAAMAAVAAATGGLGGSASAATDRMPAGPKLAYPRLKDFERLIGTPFGVMSSSVRTTATLISVTQLTMTGLPRNATAGGMRTTGEQFSLIFTGPASSPFPQGTYSLSAKSLGAFDLFLVPVAEPGAQPQYQAIIVSV
jgi:hypothetical protein